MFAAQLMSNEGELCFFGEIVKLQCGGERMEWIGRGKSTFEKSDTLLKTWAHE